MAVRSRRLATFSGAVPGALTTIWTVPANRTAIIHQIDVANTSSAATQIRVTLRTGGLLYPYIRQDLAADQAVRIAGQHVVMQAGDELRIASTVAAAGGSVWVSGSLLDGNPI